MSIGLPEEPPEWTLKLAGSGSVVRRRSPQLVLVGAQFERAWLDKVRIDTSEVSFDGDLGQSLNDLRAAARDSSDVSGFALPIARLRASMLARISGVISLDRDLGIVRPDQQRGTAAVLYAWSGEQEKSAHGPNASLARDIAECMKRWYLDVLDPWANQHSSAALALRVFKAIQSSNIHIAPVERTLFNQSSGPKRPDFGLIIRHVAERLVGEELFAGLGSCELVLDAVRRDPARSNAIELMTAPTRLPGRDETFSMAVRLTAVTMPYSRDIYLKVSATKRVWASEVPGPKRNAPFGVRAYLMAPGQPIFTISVERETAHGWQFGGDYAEWLSVSNKNQLPKTLAEAVRKQVPDASGWWVGFPQLTTLFDSVSPRTVFEGDELDLSERVFKCLSEILAPAIQFKQVSSIRRRASADVAMLRLSDLGLAGQALDETDDDEADDDDIGPSDQVETGEDQERATVQRHREQNIEALKAIHGEASPVLWSFCNSQLERNLIEKTVEQLFGDAVKVNAELLPDNTHGLRVNLPGHTLKEPARFDLRVEAWKLAAETVKATNAARHVLICAADRENGRAEDAVNYYAGIHAMCRYGDANVHHVLPIAGGEIEKAKQRFVHRLQSALLDVFFAHSGKVFGTEDFLRPLFAKGLPEHFYGVQAMRSHARSYSGEFYVSFLVFTRLHVGTGATSVRFVYREKKSTRETQWMPLSQGLRWLGSQRALDSDEQWLRISAAEQIRFWLGGVAKEDPRAVVMVDWSTMASIWRGISDEDLTFSGAPRSDGKDIATLCPQMTLVRLRRGESGIAVRARNVATFERVTRGQGLGGLQPTGEVYTEAYGTTTKAIVRITSSNPVATVPTSAHYILSMGYRKTVQILRGQSCYRTMQRMTKRKEDESLVEERKPDKLHVYELKVLDPSRQDAALPAPLEVTVMTCPADIGADNVAVAVLGMRLGYMHYSDWTSLPAPLFFKRKIDDYVIRYRSPISSTADDAADADDLTVPSSLRANGEAPDANSAESPATPDATDDYLRRAALEIVGPAHDRPLETSGAEGINGSKAVETKQDTNAVAEVHPPVSDLQLTVAAESQLDDESLLQLVKQLAHEDFALCGEGASFTRRTRYDRMMRGELRVQVPLPFFVDIRGIFGDEPPSDREALRRFWRGQTSMGWTKKDQMPSLQKLGTWVMRRLQIPQGGYSIYRSPLFPPSSLFEPVREGWKQYVAEKRALGKPDDRDVERLSDTSLELTELTQWAVSRSDDRLVAWLIFGSAQFPFLAGVLNKVIPHIAAPIGVYTREALHYFIASVRAVRGVLSIRPGAATPNLIFKARPRPENLPSDDQEPLLLDTPPASETRANLSAGPNSRVIESPSPGAAAATLHAAPIATYTSQDNAGTIADIAAQLRPGESDFESRIQVMRHSLELMEQEHLRLSAARTAAREAEERAAAAARARDEHSARWAEIQLQATRLLESMRASLPDTQPWKIALVEGAPATFDQVLNEVDRLRTQISAVRTAQDEYQVVVDRATPPSTLAPREAGRHRSQWNVALLSAHETLEVALNSLVSTFKGSQSFTWIDESENLGAPGEISTSAAPKTQNTEPTKGEIVSEPRSNDSVEMAPPSEDVPSNDEGRTTESAETDTATLAAVEPSSDYERQDSSSVESPSLMPELLAESERAEVILQLLNARAYGVAEVYVEALQLCNNTASIGDHGLVVSASLETIRRLRMDVAPEQPHNFALRTRIEKEDGPQMPACEPLAAALGVLAAGLGEMIFPQLESSGRWTFIDYLGRRLSEQPKLQQFVERAGSLEGFNIAQEVLTAATVGARDVAQTNLVRMRERAKRWTSDEALYKKWNLSDYKTLHQSLFENVEFPIARCLGVIARGEDHALEEAYRNARKKLERPLVTIDDLSKRMGRKRSIDGVGRDHIKGNIERTQQFIEEYREAVGRASGSQTPVTGNARTILQSLYQDLSAAIEIVETLTFRGARDRMYQQLAATALNELKRMFNCEEHERLIGEAEQMLMLRLPLGIDLRPSLWPQMDKAGNTVPAVVDPVDATEEVESLAQLLTEAGNESRQDGWVRLQLDRASKDHLSNNRFLPLQSIDRRLGRVESRAKEQKQCHGVLMAQLHNERQRVTHAMALGALAQSEASRMLRLIGELQQVSHSLGDIDAAPSATPDYPHAYSALRRLVTQPLEEKLTDSKRAFFQDLEKYVIDNASLPHLHTDIQRIRELANERSASSIRAARDMFSLLKDGALPKKAVAGASIAQTYRECVDTLKRDAHSHERLVETLLHKLDESSGAPEPAWLSALDSADRRDAAAFLRSWMELCSGETHEAIQPSLMDFFRGLRPISPEVVMQSSSSKSQRTEFILDSAPLAGLDRAATGVFIPPTLGSSASYIQGIVFRHRPTEGAITQAIDERAQAAPALILARGTLTMEKRASLSRHHAVLLIDDDLVAYAAVHPRERLQKLMQVALLTFHDNPYDDYGRPVPPEMFFGRNTELRRLRNVKSAAVLFGGRRLGKSSLLDQLERDADDRNGEVVLYLALDRTDHGISDDHVFLAWDTILRKLFLKGVIARPKADPTTSGQIRRWIEDEIMGGRCTAKGIYLLIDEADELMGRDLSERETFVSSLFALTDSVRKKCAMRFVIAGLHNLTRMASEENSPLGKFESIALKPFWSGEDIQRGVELIKVPLEALGFYFAPGKEDIPLRIMAVCNFYPAFIQIYCKKLVAHLYNRRDIQNPLTSIDEGDLDAVERDKDFLSDIRSKFKLNLDLDKRYSAIALILADQYYRDGAKALTASEVRALCDLVATKLFETTRSGAYESLLDEMEILTILERVSGRYALRTPNIAMMLGDRDSVDQQLDALSTEKPIQQRSRGEVRTLLVSPKKHSREAQIFPLPAAWVRGIFNGGASDQQADGASVDRDLLILVGNDISGLSEISRLKGEWEIANTATLDVGLYHSSQAARSTLVRNARATAARAMRGRWLHCVATGSWRTADLPDYARLASVLASRVPGGGESGIFPVTRLALLANPSRACEIAKLSQSGTAEDGARWRVVAVPPWNDDALFFRLQTAEKPDILNSDEARRALLQASCGFGAEIESLCNSVRTIEDALRAPGDAEGRLAPDLESFYRKIGMPAAVKPEDLKNAEQLLLILDGEPRNVSTDEIRESCKVPTEIFVFLQWMGLLQESVGGIWHVPTLYKRLLK